jgi:hypothetical protein
MVALTCGCAADTQQTAAAQPPLPQRGRQHQPSLWSGAAQPGRGVTVPVDDADDADAVRIALVVDRVRKPPDKDATKEPLDDGKLLRRFADLIDGHVECGEKVSRRHLGSIVVPLESLRNLGARPRSDADVCHLANPRAQFVAERRPRDAGVRICIRLGLAGIELRG